MNTRILYIFICLNWIQLMRWMSVSYAGFFLDMGWHWLQFGYRHKNSQHGRHWLLSSHTLRMRNRKWRNDRQRDAKSLGGLFYVLQNRLQAIICLPYSTHISVPSDITYEMYAQCLQGGQI